MAFGLRFFTRSLDYKPGHRQMLTISAIDQRSPYGRALRAASRPIPHTPAVDARGRGR